MNWSRVCVYLRVISKCRLVTGGDHHIPESPIGSAFIHSTPLVSWMPNKRKTRRGQRKNPKQKRAQRRPAGSTNRGGFGARVGSRIGASLGNFAQSAFKKLTGMGDYSAVDAPFEVSGNNILHPNQNNVGGQTLVNVSDLDKEGAIRVRHREYLRDVTTSVTFQSNPLYLNPTNPSSFPWLSTIAHNFEQWVPHALVFEFVPTSGNAIQGLSAALGSVSISTQYDVTQPAFVSKQAALNHYFASSSSPANAQMHPIECDPEQRPTKVLYVNAEAAELIQRDFQLYLLGVSQIVTQGSPSAYIGGELWLSYDITLLKPRQELGTSLMPSLALQYQRLLLEADENKADEGVVVPPPTKLVSCRTNLWGG